VVRCDKCGYYVVKFFKFLINEIRNRKCFLWSYRCAQDGPSGCAVGLRRSLSDFLRNVSEESLKGCMVKMAIILMKKGIKGAKMERGGEKFDSKMRY
jgi:hypothetical protein